MSQLFFTNVQSGTGNPLAHFGQEVFNPVLVDLEQAAYYLSGYYNISGWTTMGADAGAVTLSGITQVWKHLRLVALFRSSQGATVDDLSIGFNGAVAGHYYNSFRWVNSGISTASGVAGGIALRSRIVGNSAPADHFSPIILDIFDYTTGSIHPYLLRGYAHGSDTDADMTAVMTWGEWRGLAAITSLRFTCTSNIMAGSMYAVYGKGY